MENSTFFFLVSTGGTIVDGPTSSNQTYQYVGGITQEWETQTGNLINIWVLKDEVRRLNGGDVDIEIFFEVVNEEGLRLLRPGQMHVDVAALVDIAMDVPFTTINVIPSEELVHQLDAIRRWDSELASGDKPSHDSVRD